VSVCVLREEILRSYPSLSPEDIQAAIVYSTELAPERVVPFKNGAA
jgi:uncharacterized protein (DUF433 family)